MADESSSQSSSKCPPSYTLVECPYHCSECGARYRRRTDFNAHLLAVHPRATISYSCSYCSVEHGDFEALRRHVVERHHHRRVYECAHCHYWFKRRKAMEQHLQRHSERLRRRTCSLCAAVFSTRQKLQAHWSTRHEQARDHVCAACGERFTRCYNLRRHELEKHRQDGKTRRWVPTCERCGKVFSRKHHLDEHKCRVSWPDDEPAGFLCSVCGKGFGCKDNMLRHEKLHGGNKPYKCEVCSYEFTRKEHLIRHNRIHEYTADNYICSKCKKVYKSVGGLTKHKRICGQPVAGPSNAEST